MSAIKNTDSDKFVQIIKQLGLEYRLNPEFIKAIPGITKREILQIIEAINNKQERKLLAPNPCL